MSLTPELQAGVSSATANGVIDASFMESFDLILTQIVSNDDAKVQRFALSRSSNGSSDIMVGLHGIGSARRVHGRAHGYPSRGGGRCWARLLARQHWCKACQRFVPTSHSVLSLHCIITSGCSC